MIAHNKIQADYWDQSSQRIAKINEEMSPAAKKEIDDFFDYNSISSGANILEVGCGAGRFTLPLLRRGNFVTGTDISEKSLSLLFDKANSEKLSDKLSVCATDLILPKWSECFDMVVIGNVIHHFSPDKKQLILSNIIKALRRGGRVAIWEPNAFCPFYFPWYAFLRLSGSDRSIWVAEKGVFKSHYGVIKKMLEHEGLAEITAKWHTLIPLRLEKYCRGVSSINNFLEKTPVLKHLGAYIWISGVKK